MKILELTLSLVDYDEPEEPGARWSLQFPVGEESAVREFIHDTLDSATELLRVGEHDTLEDLLVNLCECCPGDPEVCCSMSGPRVTGGCSDCHCSNSAQGG